MLKIYQLISYLFLPIIITNLLIRIIRNKEDKKRFLERLGRTDKNFKIPKKTIWLHAASVGEFKSSDIIIKKYYKNFNILVTTTTKTSAEYVKNFYQDKVIHQYIPFDITFWCLRFINYWKPSVVLWIESDIWPNMIKIIKDKRINCFYVNARISPKSYNRWKYLNKLYTVSLLSFNKIFVQSQNDLKRIENLSNIKVDFIGNLKLSNNSKNIYVSNQKKIFSVMIVSTHQKEEEIILNSIENIIKKNNLKICIAPRHPERVYEVTKILKKYGLSYNLDSKKQNFNKDITIIDRLGKLDSYYNKSEIVILGGSFINKGGHNPIEPAKYSCAIISGNLVYNWENIYNDMYQEKACILINQIDDLKKIISQLTSNRSLLDGYKKKALDFSSKKFFEKEILFNEINMVVN